MGQRDKNAYIHSCIHTYMHTHIHACVYIHDYLTSRDGVKSSTSTDCDRLQLACSSSEDKDRLVGCFLNVSQTYMVLKGHEFSDLLFSFKSLQTQNFTLNLFLCSE